MLSVIAFILSIMFATVNGWGGCRPASLTRSFNLFGCETGGSCGNTCDFSTTAEKRCTYSGCTEVYQNSGYFYLDGSVTRVTVGTLEYNCETGQVSREYCQNGQYSMNVYCVYGKQCDSQCDLDSIANYADCVQGGNTWDSDSCKCIYNIETDSTFTICTENVTPSGSVYMEAYKVTLHYKNGQVQTACGVSPNLVQGNGYKTYCPKLLQSFGTCKQNGYQNGASPASGGEGNQSPKNQPPQCYATIGYNCYFKDRETGNTFVCECDGSCEKGFNDIANGSCKNPYEQPESSDSGGNSSDSGGNSSPSSSGSGGNSSGSGETGIYMDVLQQIQANTQGTMNNTADISQWTQETMNQTIDIKNQLTEMGIDVSHIRTNTENTAINTSNIDSKLSTTNNLLNDIKNKDWDVHFNPTIQGDTNIINVDVPRDTIINNINVPGDTNIINVQNDTTKAGAEILSYLKGLFGDSLKLNGIDTSNNYNANDTVGSGEDFASLRDSIIAKTVGDTIPNMKDSLSGAVTSVKSALSGLRDTLNNGAFGDSLDHWKNQLLSTGQISGNGSDECPNVFKRTVSWNMGRVLGTWNLGTFRYICEPITGVGISFWKLARLVLRAMVAISCMLWLYRTVAGVGGNDDED